LLQEHSLGRKFIKFQAPLPPSPVATVVIMDDDEVEEEAEIEESMDVFIELDEDDGR
jgi:hypothetical protein